MTELSARFALPLLQPGQAQKELFHNEALVRLDAALHPAVANIGQNTPPTGAAAGKGWIVGPAPTAAWAGQAGAIATWTDAGWRFVAPVAGMLAWLSDRGTWAWHDGAGWHDGPLPAAGLSVAGEQVVGARRPAIASPAGGTTVDAEARVALSAILSSLRAHGLIAT